MATAGAAFRAWRKKLSTTAVTVNRDSRDGPLTRERLAASVNRDMTALRAAVNHARREGPVITGLEWADALKPADNADGRRDV